LQAHLDGLVASMQDEGWTGRPLLVIESGSGVFFAWTGSHRIAAARIAGLDSIPCYVLDESQLQVFAHDAHCDAVTDGERLVVIRQTGDEHAIALMNYAAQHNCCKPLSRAIW
jgi:hypothetical protein